MAGTHPAKRAITHLTDPNFFVFLTRQIVGPYNSFNEILVQISSAFNTGTHAPGGTIQSTGIVTESDPTASGQAVPANNKSGNHFTWIDAAGVTCLSTWAASTKNDCTVFFTLERNTTKEYADGLTNFFCAALPNYNAPSGYQNQSSYYGTGGLNVGRAYICRPFGITEYVDYTQALATFFGAYRSPGNSKVYFEFLHERSRGSAIPRVGGAA